MTDEDFMREALEEARLALSEGELPVGCVIVQDGKILAWGRNARRHACDPTAHAEIVAMRQAGKLLGSWQLTGCTLYVTLEPCPMCAGAIVQSRLSRLVYGAFDPAQGCAGSLYRLTEDPAFTHFCPADGGVLEEACRKPLDLFFHAARDSSPSFYRDNT